MKLIYTLLLSSLLFFNYHFHFIPFKKMDYLYGNYFAFWGEAKNSLSPVFGNDQSHRSIQGAEVPINRKISKSNLLENKGPLNDNYFIFTFAIALLAIGIEIIIGKSAKITKRRNHILSLKNKVMLKQNLSLQNALITIEESNEENNRMLQIIAHDLRSPMAAIVGLSSFMIDENKLGEEDMEVIRLIHTSGVDSLKFINEILEQDTKEPEMKMVDLYQLLSYCISQLKLKAEEKEQHIILEGATCTLRMNREKIWRVITNLLSNAIKFSPPKSRIAVDLKLLAKKVVISIKDTGIGIPENLKDKIFTLSAQRKRAGTAGEKSFGMGLAIAKQNIEAHGGTLNFKSEDGYGTTFFIELPIT
jgi:signal transduction histidine kinase